MSAGMWVQLRVPRVGYDKTVERSVVHVHRAEHADSEPGSGQFTGDPAPGDEVRFTEVLDAVITIGYAGVQGRPLDPRLEVDFVGGVGDEYLRGVP